MSIIWKKNGHRVSGPEEIPRQEGAGIGVHTRGAYSKPILMESMGFLADEADVAEHRKRFPNVDLEFHQGSAIPVMRSLGQKRAYLKAAGWVDTRSY